jgi:hypothetical protein
MQTIDTMPDIDTDPKHGGRLPFVGLCASAS